MIEVAPPAPRRACPGTGLWRSDPGMPRRPRARTGSGSFPVPDREPHSHIDQHGVRPRRARQDRDDQESVIAARARGNRQDVDLRHRRDKRCDDLAHTADRVIGDRNPRRRGSLGLVVLRHAQDDDPARCIRQRCHVTRQTALVPVGPPGQRGLKSRSKDSPTPLVTRPATCAWLRRSTDPPSNASSRRERNVTIAANPGHRHPATLADGSQFVVLAQVAVPRPARAKPWEGHLRNQMARYERAAACGS